MRPTTNRTVAILGLVGVALAGVPAVASAENATLYELTENMKLLPRKQRGQAVTRRIATSALTGVAQPGTPLCPIPEFQSGPAGCAINALGKDNISLVTGLGTFEGNVTTVIQGDNPVDGPEAVVLRGKFSGQMDFSPAILHQIPYGTVTGRLQAGRGRATNFTGVFRLPFAGNVETEIEVAPGVKITLTLRQLFCPATPTPNPNAVLYGGFDLAYLDNVEAAMTPAGRCLDIQPTQLSLGAPLVLFGINF
ncbi:MAG TPA: hypothetical protein VGD07_08385 [Methylomirabilota bacterium]|jgi:hypothetical protein